MNQSKRFYEYVLPSIGAMLVIGLYFVVDGIFVGQGVGTNALASINISVPFISTITAVAMMITMGGAALAAISIGKRDYKKANDFFINSLTMVFLFSGVISLISILIPEELSIWLGANEVLLDDTATYIKYYTVFAVFLCASSFFAVFVRNDGNPRLSLWAMIIGSCSNVFLDWLFIFPLQMGVMGAGIASGLGQLVSCLVLLLHFRKKERKFYFTLPSWNAKEWYRIMKVGTPELVNEMGGPISIFFYNQIIIVAFAEIGMAAFAVIAYLLIIVLCVFSGLGQGIQPLIGQAYGGGNHKEIQFFLNKALKLSATIAVVMYLSFFFAGETIMSIFNSDPRMIQLANEGMLIYALSFLFWGLNVVYGIYYLSTEQTRISLSIAVARGFIFNSFFIVVMPWCFGEAFIWSGIVVAEALVFLLIQCHQKIKPMRQA